MLRASRGRGSGLGGWGAEEWVRKVGTVEVNICISFRPFLLLVNGRSSQALPWTPRVNHSHRPKRRSIAF